MAPHPRDRLPADRAGGSFPANGYGLFDMSIVAIAFNLTIIWSLCTRIDRDRALT